jgi:hypothetical protein
MLLHHVAKRCWFLSIANHKALQNMEIELSKLVIVLAMSSSFFYCVFDAMNNMVLIVKNVLSSKGSLDALRKLCYTITSSS